MAERTNKCTLTDQELSEKCNFWISALCKSGGESWTLRVPPDFNYDPDLLFSELIKRFKVASEKSWMYDELSK